MIHAAKILRFCKYITFLFLISGLGVGSFLNARDLKKILLEEVLSVGGLDDDSIYLWAGIDTDMKGNIYLTDTMDYSVKKFNSKGVLIKKTGRKGKGPGEFSAIRLIRYCRGLIYVTDQNTFGIKVFDENLNYKYRIPFNLPILDFKVHNTNSITILSPFIANPGGVITIDSRGNSELEQLILNDAKQYWYNFRKFDMDEQGNMYFISSFEDRVEKFDKNMKKLWTSNLMGKKKAKFKKSPAKTGPALLPTEVVYKDIVLDNFDYIFILGGHVSKHRSRDVFVLDRKTGKHLTTFVLPEPSHCIHIDKDNFIYSRSQEGICLKKYALKYEYSDPRNPAP